VTLRTDDFDYDLPASFIAQHPVEPRDSCRLLLVDRASDRLTHHTFRDLPELLTPGDLLVLNDTRVIPARLHVHKRPGGGKAELLLLRQQDDARWEAWVGGRGMAPGRQFEVAPGIEGEIEGTLPDGRRIVTFDPPAAAWLDRLGEMPLPPYIREPMRDAGEYQTVYARQAGSAAAPTAGLHFTPGLLDRLEARGVCVARTTLHVGLDTFAPVKESDPSRHPIHTEWCQVKPAAAEAIQGTRARGGRILAVGTTAVRTLETCARMAAPPQVIAPYAGPTDLYILPGFPFRIVDAMITNFHLPRSTLLMMVSAFAGRERILHAYRQAQDAGYRFYSFGDAMLIV
jgi:S-adenosylmethionine:tRNA ribosyltransferase-isomerase